MHKIIKRVLAAGAVGVALTVTAQPAAHAADPRITVCSSSYSWERIRAYNNDTGYSKIIYPGGCATDVNDRSGHARVDVDPAGVVDVQSWTKRKIGDPWTSLCYPGENHASDPFSAPAPGTSYWNFQTGNCTVG